MHRALYRTYRPAKFSEVVGQDHVTSVLRYQVKEHRTSHAYLFCGSRGTGKTSCAKILSKAVNCLDPIDGEPCGVCENCKAIEQNAASDILEMDAASNTGVDYIRDIKDAVVYAPTMLKCRVYIIDEVHMLTDNAFNALLKTLEEPPSDVLFILATTEMQKIPATVLSRCQCFEFRRISAGVIAEQLGMIAKRENVELDPDAAFLIARTAQGGMRDAISLFELCSADGERVTAEKVERLSGGAGRRTVERTVSAVLDKDSAALFEIVAELYAVSGDLSSFWQELFAFYRDLTVVKTMHGISRDELRREILDLTEGEFEKLTAISDRFRYETLLYHISVLDQSYAQVSGKGGLSSRISAEMALLRMTNEQVDSSPQALLARIASLENTVSRAQAGESLSSPPPKSRAQTEKADLQSGESLGISDARTGGADKGLKSAPADADPGKPATEEKKRLPKGDEAKSPLGDEAKSPLGDEAKSPSGDEMKRSGVGEKVPSFVKTPEMSKKDAAGESFGEELKDFIELKHEFFKIEPAAASALRNARAYINEKGVLTVVVFDNFSYDILNRAQAEKKLEGIYFTKRSKRVKVEIKLMKDNEKKDELDDLQ